MKTLLITIICVMYCSSINAQSQEAKQLLLNWEKLTQFKLMLRDMRDGWKIINEGYETVRKISAGNFDLHKDFLDALLDVSPAVKGYKRIADIINYQRLIVTKGKKFLHELRTDEIFSSKEIEYVSGVINDLFNESLENIEELLLVITAGQLSMNDNERIDAIDNLFDRVSGQYYFFNDLSNSTRYLSLQRRSEQSETELLKKIHGY